MNNQYCLSVNEKKVDHMGQIDDELTLLKDFCSPPTQPFLPCLCLGEALRDICVVCNKQRKDHLNFGNRGLFCMSMRDRNLIKGTRPE